MGDHVAHETKGGVGRILRRLDGVQSLPADEREARLNACETECEALLAARRAIFQTPPSLT